MEVLSMFEINVNGRTVQAKEGDTILQALERIGINVPTLCHMKGLPPSGACRICVVECEGMRGLIPSCSYPVTNGMKIKTNSKRVIDARKTIIALLLANHPDDCLYCVRNGNCELQNLAEEYAVRERRYPVKSSKIGLDVTSPSIIRDPAKCILCGKCVRVCDEVQKVSSIDFVRRGSKMQVCPAFEESLNVSSCINCGQCVNVCPTGALREKSYLQEVHDALQNPELVVVAQHAPAVSVSIAEEFGLKPGTDVNGIFTAALREIGFKYVFETSFSADLTIMEEASELANRIKNGGVLPMLTSCSPGWIKYIEQFYPELLPNLSTCKSPQQMLGALIKSYFPKAVGLKPEQIYSVSIMPCTAKKFEAARPEMAGKKGLPDIDAVLTTREIARLIKLCGVNMNALEPAEADTPFGTKSSAGKLFGASGGVMEAAIRTAHYFLTGKDLSSPKIEFARGLEGVKEGSVKIGDLTLRFAVVNGIGNAPQVLDQIKKGKSDLHFVEVMTCSGGCVAGGGQPLGTDLNKIKARIASLYSIDSSSELRFSHRNPYIQKIYKDFLEKPLSEKSHELLHTHYRKRKVKI